MKWKIRSKHYTKIKIDGEIFEILCDVDVDGIVALSINDEYVDDLSDIPSHDELIAHVKEFIKLRKMTTSAFLRRSL